MDRREALKMILPGGWLFGVKDAGSLDPRKWGRASRVGLGKDLALLGFPIGCAPKPKTESPTPSRTPTLEPSSRPERKLSLKFVSPEQETSIEVFFRSERVTGIDKEPLEKMFNLLLKYRGILPEKFTIVFQEEGFDNPLVLGMTNSKSDKIFISLGRLFSHPEDFVPEGYSPGAIANGVLGAEIFNLMFSECQCLPTADIPVTKDNVEKLGDSFGMMVAAILSQRTYDQYDGDIKKFLYQGKETPFSNDSETYRVFQQALSKPLLVFAKN